jgi:hypothetical protein
MAKRQTGTDALTIGDASNAKTNRAAMATDISPAWNAVAKPWHAVGREIEGD